MSVQISVIKLFLLEYFLQRSLLALNSVFIHLEKSLPYWRIICFNIEGAISFPINPLNFSLYSFLAWEASDEECPNIHIYPSLLSANRYSSLFWKSDFFQDFTFVFSSYSNMTCLCMFVLVFYTDWCSSNFLDLWCDVYHWF